jgi:hypothetical protein
VCERGLDRAGPHPAIAELAAGGDADRLDLRALRVEPLARLAQHACKGRRQAFAAICLVEATRSPRRPSELGAVVRYGPAEAGRIERIESGDHGQQRCRVLCRARHGAT